jgi:hypothetical protein
VSQIDLGGQPDPQVREVEQRERTDGSPPLEEGIPRRLTGQSQGGDDADAGDENAHVMTSCNATQQTLEGGYHVAVPLPFWNRIPPGPRPRSILGFGSTEPEGTPREQFYALRLAVNLVSFGAQHAR